MKKQSIVLASNNHGKIKEIQAAFRSSSLEIIPQSDLHIAEAEETGLTFIENALIKARYAAKHSGLPAIADDSGLMVDALLGAPGVYSARYAGANANAQANIQKLLIALQDTPLEKRSAKFCCTLVYLRSVSDPYPMISQAIWQGSILLQPQGEQGFGYDPIFYLSSHHCSAAELPLNEKNRLSHRGQALTQLINMLTRAHLLLKEMAAD